MKICFLARPIYDKVSTRIYNCIKENFDSSVQACFVTTKKEETEYVRSCVKDANIEEIHTYIREHWDEYDVNDLIRIEKEYNCNPIWSYIYTDRFLINREYDYAVKMTVGLFSFFEYLYVGGGFDYYYSETVATLLCYASYIVGKKYGVKYVSQVSARGLDSSHHYILDDPFQGNARMAKDYTLCTFGADEMKRADQFLKEFERRDIRPTYMIRNGAVPKLHLQYLKLPLKRVAKSFSSEYKDPYSYINYQSHKEITNPIKFYFRYQKAKQYYHTPDFSRKYVYFPLHFQPEASTIVCAAKYEKQLYYIDSWAKSLPADTVLYVKEHYAVLGHRDLQFYEELKKYPNVILIDPYESSRKLIENCFAMTTLTGTAGWEAMLLRKPVILGGNIFFDNAPGVIKVEDIYQHYVENIEKWEQPKREEIIKYLCAYFRSLREGSIERIWRTEDQKNVLHITRSLYEYLTANEHA